MTLVSNDPSWWPFINSSLISSYFVVASSVVMIYDWALTSGQEVELVWRQRWSLMTALYLSVRYVGIIFVVINILCRMMYVALDWMSVTVNAILGVIMIVRLHAMYQQSRKVLILIVVIFLAFNITGGMIIVIFMRHVSGEVLILSGTHQCSVYSAGDTVLLNAMSWILCTVWEILALCLALWIAVKHFRELRRSSAGGIIEDCFTVLMKTHVVYFASFVVVSCLELSYLSPTLSANLFSLETQTYLGCLQIFSVVQMFVLGPRLILSLREYNARLVTDSDAATAMTSIAFHVRGEDHDGGVARSNLGSGFAVASSAAVIYDWALTFGQEVELVWKQRWSLMTVLYLSVRYIGIPYLIVTIMFTVPTISLTDEIMTEVLDWTSAIVNAILGVIMIVRLYAMYQRSRNVLIVLVVIFLAVNITNAVLVAIITTHTSGEELVLSGTYQCTFQTSEQNALIMGAMTWALITVWEVLALCFAVWIAVIRFRELRRSSRGWIVQDCFTVLMKTHVVYFARDIYSMETEVYLGFLQIFELVQMFVLGPRLILGVREFNAKQAADPDAGTNMTSVAFQERVHISTGSGV
ncbi:hypothetical protein DFH29DRAFT_1080753 [Suillus ampliporus]|nr:hypothetical protein DFH29DRAFT_1080753 [Suillus ampliporus]